MIRSAREAIRRLQRLYAELDYAQRRLLEIQTGLVLTAETKRRIARAEIDRLNALWTAEDHPAGSSDCSSWPSRDPNDDPA